MPVAREEPVTPTLKQVAFATTPKMSTYLFVLAAGELERLSKQVDGVTISVIATAGKRDQGSFALESAASLLRYFNDYFELKYPLPKLDLIAVPGGFRGAMENWGAITSFESRLLFDPATTAPSARRGIFLPYCSRNGSPVVRQPCHHGVVGRSLAQRGFRQLDGGQGDGAFFPHWRIWLNGTARKQFAMGLDARRTSHPIQQPVANESEATQHSTGSLTAKGRR